MEHWGLVFAGGGGKGAYQIGVWRALRRLGLDGRISVVSGTSVGAINAALFAQGSLKTAKEVWTALEPGQIFFPDKAELPSVKEPAEDTKKKVARLLFGAVASSTVGFPLFPSLGLIASASALTDAIQEMRGKGIVTNGGLYHLIKTYLDPQKIIHSPLKCYATCMSDKAAGQGVFSPTRTLLNTCPPEKIPSVILASAAIPYVFPAVEIEGDRYHDGGVPWEKKVGSDNIPITPVYEEGCRTILVVHMGKRGVCGELAANFPGARLIEVCPEKPMAIPDTLNFSHDFVMERMKEGYEEGDFILEDLLEE